MTVQLLIAFAAFLFEYKDFVTLAPVAKNCSLHDCALNVRSAYFYLTVVVHKHDCLELYGLTFLLRKAVHKDFLLRSHLELVTADFYNSVHCTIKTLKSPDCRRSDARTLNRACQSLKMGCKYITFFSSYQRIHYFCDYRNNIVMSLYFNSDIPASGKSFIGRKNDINYLSNLIGSGESIALYGEPHQGRGSLVKQTFTSMQMSGKGIPAAEVDLLGARTNEDVLLRYVTAVTKLLAPSLDELRDLTGTYLEGTGLELDCEQYMCDGRYFSFVKKAGPEACRRILSLPYELTAAQPGEARAAIYFRHFQNAGRDSGADMLLKEFESVVAQNKGKCSMVFTGDRLNAMKEIFEVKRHFWKDVIIYPLSEIPAAEITEYVHRGFQLKGKVIERSLISEAVNMVRGNMWYVNAMFAMTDYVSVGYATQKTFDEAFGLLMSMHRGRFIAQVSDLTDFQARLLKAVIDGEERLSSSAIVERYSLNSSANVKRLKDALVKKEVLWFDEKDIPHIQDPVFELWLRKEYFAE